MTRSCTIYYKLNGCSCSINKNFDSSEPNAIINCVSDLINLIAKFNNPVIETIIFSEVRSVTKDHE